MRHGRQMPGNNGIIRATVRIINTWRADMSETEEIHRLIDAFENNTFTTGLPTWPALPKPTPSGSK
jgi:hypothetical protein